VLGEEEQMLSVLPWAIRYGLILLLAMPLIVTPQTIFPFIVGKVLYARGLIEIVTAVWVVLMLWDARYRPSLRSWILVAFAGYVGVALLSAFWGVSITRSLWSNYERMMGVWDLIHWFLLFLVTVSVVRRPQEWRALFNWMLVVTLLLELLGLAQAFGWRAEPNSRVEATLGNPSYLAAILVVGILLAIGLLARSFAPRDSGEQEPPGSAASPSRRQGPRRRERKRRRARLRQESLALWGQRSFWALVSLLGMWALFATGTRGALAGLVGGLFAVALACAIRWNRRTLRPVGVAAGGLLLAIVVLYALSLTAALPNVPGVRESDVLTRLVNPKVVKGDMASRFISSEAGVRAFLQRPLLGWGPENFEVAFDRFAEPSWFIQSPRLLDQAHNKIVEELTTKGALGALFYLTLWAAVVWRLIQRRRPAGDEALAYAVLGALTGYFVQNLFLFDTPAMLLPWVLLVAYAAAQEQTSGEAPRVGLTPRKSGGNVASRPFSRPGIRSLSKVAASVAALLLLGFSLYYLNYRPYAAARSFQDALNPGPVAQQLEYAQTSFALFPPMATLPRQMTLEVLASRWANLSAEERQQALAVESQEGRRALQAEPSSFLVLRSIVSLRQSSATSPEEAAMIDPLVQILQQVAPGRPETHVFLARQALLKGNYREAIRIADAYEAHAAGTGWYFEEVKRTAEERLKSER
jgi:O-antigen ligase